MKNAVFLDVTPVAIVITNVSEHNVTSIVRVIRISELLTTLAICFGL
jgi:hypothetical protein